ncbi:MAG: hypothetical protein GF364_19585 [Candidatus Lokiarchaeota archaeon]|nr:hypothetical protein [Candidatus Lokiarchaeota archaeon]
MKDKNRKIDVDSWQFKRLREILKEEYHIKNKKIYSFVRQEASKRNIVYSISCKYIEPSITVKIYKIPQRQRELINEINIFHILREHQYVVRAKWHRYCLCKVPEMISSGMDYILTKYVDGVNLTDIIQNRIQETYIDWDFLRDLINCLILWLDGFYQKTNNLPDNCHIRNFSYKKGNKQENKENILYGFDFEELMQITNEKDQNSGEKFKNKEAKFLKAIARIYFSILAAKPGIVEGKSIKEKMKLGVIILNNIFDLPLFIFKNKDNNLKNKKRKELSRYFLQSIQSQGKEMIQQRIKYSHVENYDVEYIEENIQKVIRLIRREVNL